MKTLLLPVVIMLLFCLGDTWGEDMEAKAEGTIIPEFKLDLTTPAQALQTIESKTGIKVFYTPRPKDWPTFSVALKNIPASEALEFVSMVANLQLTYSPDGAHLEAHGPQPKEFGTLRDAEAIRFYQTRAIASRKSFVVKVGDKAPVFSCQTISGEAFALDQEKGKVVLLDFFATWCAPCVAEMPHLENEVFQKYKDRKDFRLLALGCGHEAADLEKFRKEKNLSLPMAPDAKKEIYAKYATNYIPKLCLIGRDGTIKLAVSGNTEKTMQSVLDALQKELGAP